MMLRNSAAPISTTIDPVTPSYVAVTLAEPSESAENAPGLVALIEIMLDGVTLHVAKSVRDFEESSE